MKHASIFYVHPKQGKERRKLERKGLIIDLYTTATYAYGLRKQTKKPAVEKGQQENVPSSASAWRRKKKEILPKNFNRNPVKVQVFILNS